MKKCLLASILLFLCVGATLAQGVQRGFSFQGYARDLEGAALASQSVTVRFSIYPKNGSNEFQEEQTITTDPYGVFQLMVGSTKLTDFSKMNFGAKDYWLRVESKANGGDYAEINNTQLTAVPYAKSAENGLPPGTILPFGGNKANVPAGFLACDGSQYNASTYPDLYNAIGSNWGGDASSFRVPDLRGFFLRGANESTGIDPDAAGRTAKYAGGRTGDNVGAYQEEGTKSHNHTGATDTDGAHTHNSVETARADNDDNDEPHNYFTPEDANYYEGHANIPSTGSDHKHNFTTNTTGGNETRPKNAAVLYIIKY
jgi:microcystin-dependent protein